MPRISDARMVELWEEREELRLRAAKLAKKQKAIDAKMIEEFERRGTTSLKNGGTQVTYVRSETVVYVPDVLETRLKRTKKGREVLNRVQKLVIDMRAVAGEVQAGNIPSSVVAEASTIQLASPYVRGSKVTE